VRSRDADEKPATPAVAGSPAKAGSPGEKPGNDAPDATPHLVREVRQAARKLHIILNCENHAARRAELLAVIGDIRVQRFYRLRRTGGGRFASFGMPRIRPPERRSTQERRRAQQAGGERLNVQGWRKEANE